MATFIQDDSIQGTTTSILSTGTNVSIFATTTNLNNLSTNSTLSINNLNATSTTIFNNLNTLSSNSTNNINSLSSNSTLSINNLISTSNTIFNNLNSFSTNSTLTINGHTTQITNLNTTSTSLLGLINGHTTQITNLNTTSTSLLGLINTHTTQITNLNSTSTSLLGLINGHTTQITNLNTTSTTIFNNLNSLSGQSYFLTNYTNLSSLNVSGTTKLNGATTCLTTLNIKGRETNEGMTIADGSTYINQYQLLFSPPTLTTNSTIQTIQQNVGFNQVLDLQPFGGSIRLSGNTTCSSTLNVVGNITTSGLSVFNINSNLNSISSYSYLNLSSTSSLLSTKQNNLTFSNPFLNTSNTISLKYDNTKLNVDASGNLTVIGGGTSSQWTTTGTSIFYNTGNVGIGTNSPSSLLHIKGTNPALTVMGQGNAGATSSINLNTFDNLTNPGSCSLIATDTGSYGNTFKINLKTAGGTIATSQFTAFYIDNTGKVNIGSQAPNNIFQVDDGARLRISNGETDYTLIGTKAVDDTNNTRIVISGNTRASPYNGNIEYIATSGAHAFYTSAANQRMIILNNGNVGIGTNNPNCSLQVNGICNIHGGDPYAVKNNYMQKGSLTIGDSSLNYGGGSNWTTNTSGLMLECLNNTEIAVHDAGNRIASLMYFEGGSTNRITIGRNMFWGAISDVVLNGNVSFTNELKSNHWKFTNQSDYCRLYNLAGTSYFKFAANELYADGVINCNGGKVHINAAEWSSGGTKGIFFRSGYTDYNCSIMTYDHLGDGFCDGISINAWDGISFCTGSNSRQERMRITNTGNVSCTGNFTCNDTVNCNKIYSNQLSVLSGNVGINNTSPWAPLNIGNSDIQSDGYIVFAKNNLGNRNCRVGYNSNFGFSIGDNGNVNNNTNSWTVQFAIAYNAPFASLGANEVGRVIMQYGYGTTSDERIKTNIKTIENALDKTLLLRGVNYYDFRIEPDRLKMGLIAQEAELIIPEVVHTDTDTTMKSIEYGSIVGLLIEAIKEQQKQINDLKNILIKNNLN